MKRSTLPIGLLVILTGLLIAAFGASPASAHPDCTYIELSEEATDCTELGEGFEVGEWENTLVDVPGDPVDPAVATFTKSDNLTPLGYSARVVPTSGTGNSLFNSDPAYQDGLLYQGTYAGFRIIDVSDPTNPTQLVNYTACAVGQGDVIVYGNILVRAWDSATSNTCGGVATGSGFEGVHIFDVSDPRNPVRLQQIRMASTNSGPFVPGGTLRNTPTASNVGCGSHTLSLVPDAARGNIYVYSSASSGTCTGIDIIRVPLTDPGNSGIVRRAAAGRQCHDTTIHLGTGRVACAGGNGWSTLQFDLALPADAPGGVENPTLIRSNPVGGVSIGHSHAFSNDGSTLIFGHEPGGGSAAQCQASSSATNRTLFFYDPITGAVQGTYLQPRPQSSAENCTWHNFNVVPTNRADIGVIGSYQMGITVIDFTNRSAVQQIAFADPAPLSPTALGGDWSTYWFNGKIYESDIRRGILIWNLDDRRVQGAKTTGLWNAQTQTFNFEKDRTKPRILENLPAVLGLGAEHAAEFECVDDVGPETSDIWSCEGTVDVGENLDTSTVGTKSFTIDAEDGAGNTETLTVTYEVIWDQYAGFFRPIGDENNNQAGSAVPVKFSLGGDFGLDVIADGYPQSKACGADDSTAVAAKDAEPFTYSAVLDEYKYVWKTERSWGGTCRELIVKLDDNTIHRATFNLRR